MELRRLLFLSAIDKNGNVVCWTKGAEKIFSIKKDEIIGKPITNYFTRENLEILNSLNKGESVYRHQHHARKDLVVLINSNPVVYKDEIIRSEERRVGKEWIP